MQVGIGRQDDDATTPKQENDPHNTAKVIVKKVARRSVVALPKYQNEESLEPQRFQVFYFLSEFSAVVSIAIYLYLFGRQMGGKIKVLVGVGCHGDR